jgi:hypothetical protein
MILAVDPGKTTGLSWWTDDYEHRGMEQVPLEDIPTKWFELSDTYGPIKLAIVEEFVLFGKRAVQQTGSRMEASQGVGMIKALASANGCEVVIQPSSIKTVALKWSGIKMPSNHKDTHEYDAYLHGYYYFVKEGKIKTALQRSKNASP